MVGGFLVNTNIWLWHLHDLLPEKERQKFQPPVGKSKEEVLQEVEEFFSKHGNMCAFRISVCTPLASICFVSDYTNCFLGLLTS